MKADMSWFAARLLMESRHPNEGEVEPLFEEKIVLVSARTDQEARQKAAAFGKSSEEAYENAEGNPVQWVFLEVLDVKELFDNAWEDGAEVYYGFIGREDVAHLRRQHGPERQPVNASRNGR